MFTIPSPPVKPVTPLQKAQAVYHSLMTQNPLYLGRGFSMSKNPAEEIPFSELLAGCNKNFTDYQQLEFTLQTIEHQRNLSKVTPTHHITTAVSSVLPMTATPYALSLAPMTTFPSFVPSATSSVAMQPSSMSLASSTQMAATPTFYPFSYHSRVNLWFTNPSEALATNKYHSLSPQVQKKVIWVHSFSIKVDAFVDSKIYGATGVWNNKHWMVYIPAEVEYKGVKTRGGFQYTFLPDGTCYHRAWGEKNNPDIQAIWDQVDFPEESESKLPPPQEAVDEFSSHDIHYDPELGRMILMDGNRRITLFER